MDREQRGLMAIIEIQLYNTQRRIKEHELGQALKHLEIATSELAQLKNRIVHDENNVQQQE